jgi:uncharacterized protein (DUF58 family)
MGDLYSVRSCLCALSDCNTSNMRKLIYHQVKCEARFEGVVGEGEGELQARRGGAAQYQLEPHRRGTPRLPS